jgi:hypothetical protein
MAEAAMAEATAEVGTAEVATAEVARAAAAMVVEESLPWRHFDFLLAAVVAAVAKAVMATAPCSSHRSCN